MKKALLILLILVTVILSGYSSVEHLNQEDFQIEFQETQKKILNLHSAPGYYVFAGKSYDSVYLHKSEPRWLLGLIGIERMDDTVYIGEFSELDESIQKQIELLLKRRIENQK